MTVYEIGSPSDSTRAFEVDNDALWKGGLLRVLASAPDVTAVRPAKAWGDENRAYFRYRDVPFVVWEPFGDNSRYWIGPAEQGAPPPDLTALIEAFRAFEPPTSMQLLGDLVPLRFVTRWFSGR